MSEEWRFAQRRLEEMKAARLGERGDERLWVLGVGHGVFFFLEKQKATALITCFGVFGCFLGGFSVKLNNG